MNQSARDVEISRLAWEIVRTASEAEPQVTADLLEIAGRAGANLDATFVRDGKTYSTLDMRLKTVESIESKIQSIVRQEEDSAETAAAEISDALRYTFVLDSARYGYDIAGIVDSLVGNGYRAVRFKNFWQFRSGYAGINMVWQSPNGTRFEIQFHTQRTLETKEVLSHQLYERLRILTPRSDEWIATIQEIGGVWRDVRTSPPSMIGLAGAERYLP